MKKHFFRNKRNLKESLVLFNTLLIVLIVTANIIIFSVYSKMNYKELLTSTQYNSIAQIGNSYEAIIKYAQNTIIRKVYMEKNIYNGVKNYNSGSASKMELIKELESILAEGEYVESAYIYLYGDNIMINSSKNKNRVDSVSPESFYDREIISAAQDSGSYISSPRILLGEESYVVTIAFKAYSEGTREGILVANINIGLLSQEILSKELLTDENISIAIKDKKGNIFYGEEAAVSSKSIVTEYVSDELGWTFTYCRINGESGIFVKKTLWFLLFSAVVLLLSLTITIFVISRSTQSANIIIKTYYKDFWQKILTDDIPVDENTAKEMKQQDFELVQSEFYVAVSDKESFDFPVNDNIKAIELDNNVKAAIIKKDPAIDKQLEKITEKIYIGKSAVKSNITSLHSAYVEARECLNFKICSGSKLIEYDKIKSEDTVYVYDYNVERKLINNITAGNSETAVNICKKLFADFKEAFVEDSKILNVVYQLYNAVLNQLSAIPYAFEATGKNIVFAEIPPNELEEKFTGQVELLCSEMKLKKEENEEGVPVKEIIEEIDKSFTDKDFCLDRLVDKFNVNKNVISKIVKNETHRKFSEYVNFKKIEHAKRLLSETDETIESISEKLGFSYSYYFIKVFKEFEGVTPKQFRSVGH